MVEQYAGAEVFPPEGLLVDDVEAHAAGVRGVRFNAVSPVGLRDDAAPTLACLAQSLHRLGRHAQWYADAQALPDLAALKRAGACAKAHPPRSTSEASIDPAAA